tara:strand:+ start:1939 stop:2607 length:669 start_codon:yes stop_codon:yes gene_type:complete
MTNPSLNQLLLDTKNSLEHPVYHPERWLSNHILLVTLRAVLISGNINVILAALLHDLMKPQKGEFVETEAGPYWSNPKHAGQIASVIDENGGIAYFIRSMGGDIKHVSDMCRYHMGVKDGATKKSRFTPHMDLFPVLDDMVDRKPIGEVLIPSIILPGDKSPRYNAILTFCGMSPIQIRTLKHAREFTITLNRTPYTFRFNMIPTLVEQFNPELADVLKILI